MDKDILKEKITLEEPDDLVDVEFEEPIEVDSEEIQEEPVITDDELEMSSLKSLITDTTTGEWSSIDSIKSILITMGDNLSDDMSKVSDILNEIIDDKTVIIGMLQKATDLLGPDTTELINKGVEKAEEIASSTEHPKE